MRVVIVVLEDVGVVGVFEYFDCDCGVGVDDEWFGE